MNTMAQSPIERIPITLLAGFLGSGKTTLANRILSEPHGERIAVIVNEFGEVGIDGRLVIGVEENVVQLSNGCLCCTVRGDLATTLHALLERRRQEDAAPFARVLIEASGLASPGPAVQTILADRYLTAHYRMDGVITLVNAPHIVRQLAEHPEASAQIGYADHVIVNHCDQCEPAGVAAAQAAIRACNPHASIEQTSHARVEISRLLHTHTWDTVSPRFGSDAASVPAATPHTHEDGHEHSEPHTCGVSTLTLRLEVPLDVNRLKLWLLFIVKRRSHELMRFKGILRCHGSEVAVIVQGVYQWLELRPAQQPPPAESVLVLIGRNLDATELQREWAECYARG